MEYLHPTKLVWLRAWWWQRLGAKLFGTKFEYISDGYHVRSYRWRGRLYVDRFGRV